MVKQTLQIGIKQKSCSLTSVTAWMDAPCFSSSSITLILFFLQAMWSGVKPFYREKNRLWCFLLQLSKKIWLLFAHNQRTEELTKLCFQTNENTWLLLLNAWQTCLSTVFFLSSFFPHKLQRHARSVTITSEHDSIHCALCQKRLFTDRHGAVQKQSMLHVIAFPPSAHT